MANCSDGRPPPSDFDVVVHNRMYTTRFEGRDEAQFRGKDTRGPPDLRLEKLPPFWELVRPIARYVVGRGLRPSVFLASNVAVAKREIARRFVDFGVTVCEVSADFRLLKHPDKMERAGQLFCDECIDITFSEWMYLSRAKHLIAQLGMHCLDDLGTCLSPKDRILGRASSFSHVAATRAEVPTVTVISGADLDPTIPVPQNGQNPAGFSPPGFRNTNGITLSCKTRPAVDAYRQYPDPRDIRRRGGVPHEPLDKDFRKAYFDAAFASGGPSFPPVKPNMNHAAGLLRENRPIRCSRKQQRLTNRRRDPSKQRGGPRIVAAASTRSVEAARQ